ncbi:MAG TPA: formate dehydrogenase accessory sulfurtransferase FdhD [Verrucomicrobiales bacterium]|nr:formate dehydrogenase accessory sulfurtransferase FdhD [Verrucomicrobiales bacterium]
MRRLILSGEGVEARGETEDAVAVEEPLEILVEGRSVAVVMRTPGHDRELAAGFLLSEGVIGSVRDVFEISRCASASPEGEAVEALLARPEEVNLERLTRHVFTSSSCGVCGKASIEAAMKTHPPLEAPQTRVVRAEVLFSLPEKQRAAQPAFGETGGIHASALFDLEGNLIMTREDVGRHNALDKVIGAALLEDRLPLEKCILLLSGRASFELVQKALAARIPIVAAVGAPSSLAVQLAKDAGITLCGFLKGERCNVYAHGERLTHR